MKLIAAKLEKLKYKTHKKGRRTYGAFYPLPSGKIIYLAWRSSAEMFRAGKISNSEAIREGVAEWAIDYDDLLKCRLMGINSVGILEYEWSLGRSSPKARKRAKLWLTSLEQFLKPPTTSGTVAHRNYSSRGGSQQRYLNLSAFTCREGSVSL